LDVGNSKSILDCGCGSGLNATQLLMRKPDDATLALSDLSEGMLKRAKYRLNTFMKNPIS